MLAAYAGHADVVRYLAGEWLVVNFLFADTANKHITICIVFLDSGSGIS